MLFPANTLSSTKRPERVGTRLNFKVISATCEVGTVAHPDSLTLKDFRPPSERARRLTRRFTPRFLQIIFGTYAKLCRRGFLEVLSTSALFRNMRRFVPRSRNRHSSSGFFVNCRSCRQKAFASTAIQPDLRRPPDALLRALPCLAFRETYAHEVWCTLRSFVLPEEPFAISCDSCPLAVSLSILLAPSTARPKTLGRNFRAFIPSWKL